MPNFKQMKFNSSILSTTLTGLIGLTLSYSPQAHCWGALGHQIVGAVADERMEPATRAYVSGILGIEPTAIAATWADAVRDDERFGHDERQYDQNKKDADNRNFSDYHFVDVPVGTTYDTRKEKDFKDAVGAIAGAVAILKDSTGHSNRPEKIIALRYLVHLIGDIHQPLHVGNGHDLGANFCSVLWQTQSSPENLHAVWDGNLVTALGATLIDPTNSHAQAPRFYSEYLAAFKKLRTTELSADKPKDVSIAAVKNWITESAAIRDNVALSGNANTTAREIGVYPEKPGALSAFPNEEYQHRPYCMWFSDQRKNIYGSTSPHRAKDIPPSVLPHIDDVYIKVNTAVVEQQLINSGIRLAAVLDDIAQTVGASARPGRPLSTSEQDAVLDSVQKAFHNKMDAPAK